MSVLGLAARYHAYEAVMAWQRNNDTFINNYFDRLDRGKSELSAADLALSREIALGVVRYSSLYETIIRKFLKGKKQAPELLIILSIAAHQIFVLERIPDHAIGQCCVELARRVKRQHLQAVVNAVIRKLIALRDPDAAGVSPRILSKHMPNDMAHRYSFPAVFVSDIQKSYKKNWREILNQLNHLSPICLRRSAHAPEFTSEHIIKTEGLWTWWDNPKAALEMVKEGLASVQDYSQSHVMRLAAIQSGDCVVDLCAAPGGKASAACEFSEHVFAADIQLKKVRDMAGRFPCLVQDASQPAIAAASCDVVIVDVPCSNSGVFARRAEARWRYSHAANESLIDIQQKILQSAAALVKESATGRLIYSTCSINPSENQQQVERFIASSAVSGAVSDAGSGVASSGPTWKIVDQHCALPDQWQAGAYVALLQRS